MYLLDSRKKSGNLTEHGHPSFLQSSLHSPAGLGLGLGLVTLSGTHEHLQPVESAEESSPSSSPQLSLSIAVHKGGDEGGGRGGGRWIP